MDHFFNDLAHPTGPVLRQVARTISRAERPIATLIAGMLVASSLLMLVTVLMGSLLFAVAVATLIPLLLARVVLGPARTLSAVGILVALAAAAYMATPSTARPPILGVPILLSVAIVGILGWRGERSGRVGR